VKDSAAHLEKGFTVLELICVLAVIFFLFALLMPSLSKVKRISTRVVCATNLKVIGTIGSVYLNDYESLFPDPAQWFYTADSDTPDHPIGCRWHDWPMALHGDIMQRSPQYQGMMGEYLSDLSKTTCPDFRDFAKKRGCENPLHNPKIDIRPQSNYTMNAYLGSDIQGSVKSVQQVSKPGIKFFFGEENSWSVRPDHPQFPARYLKAPLSTKALDDTALWITPSPDAENCLATFHGASRNLSDGYANLVYIDGHVDLISAGEQLRQKMHGQTAAETSYERNKKFLHPAGNLWTAWPNDEPPPGGWDEQ